MNLVPPADSGPLRRLLVTGFGPFHDHTLNPSGEIALRADSGLTSGIGVQGRILQTSWDRAWPSLVESWRQWRPDALLMLGVCNDPFFRLERRARNFWRPEVDADRTCLPSFCGPDGILIPGAPVEYEATFPFETLESRLRARPPLLSFPIHHSHDAGSFVCNQVYYLALHYLTPMMPSIGLIHVPPAQPSVIEDGLKLLSEVVAALIQSARDSR